MNYGVKRVSNSRRLLVALGDGLPVDRVEPGRHVVRALVLVLQVVGVLPHVHAEDGRHAVHVRAVLVGVALDRELAARVGDEPSPAAPELAHCSLGELLLERVVRTEGAVDGVADAARRGASPTRAHDRPEDRVVRVPAGVVAQDVAYVLGHRADSAQKVLDRLRGELGVLLERPIRVVHVGLVMPVVMDLHGLGVDVRFQRVEAIGKRWKLISHAKRFPLSEAADQIRNQSKNIPGVALAAGGSPGRNFVSHDSNVIGRAFSKSLPGTKGTAARREARRDAISKSRPDRARRAEGTSRSLSYVYRAWDFTSAARRSISAGSPR